MVTGKPCRYATKSTKNGYNRLNMFDPIRITQEYEKPDEKVYNIHEVFTFSSVMYQNKKSDRLQ